MATSAQLPPPLTSTTLTSNNGVVTAFHITSPLNVVHRILVAVDSKQLSILDSQGGNEKNLVVGGEGSIWAITSWEDGWFATGGEEGVVSIWDLKTLKKTHTLPGHTSTVRSLQPLSPTALISSSRDTTIRIWDISLPTATCTATLTGHTATIRSLSLQENLLISGGYEKNARIWDLISNECKHVLEGHTDKIYVVKMDGRLAVTGSADYTARVWDVGTGKNLATLTSTGLISNILITPTLIITATNTGTLQIWSRTNYTILHAIQAHSNSIVSMEGCSEGRRVVTGSSDGTVKVWDVETGKVVRELVNNKEAVWNVGCFENDGERVVATFFARGGDVVVETWSLETSVLLP